MNDLKSLFSSGKKHKVDKNKGYKLGSEPTNQRAVELAGSPPPGAAEDAYPKSRPGGYSVAMPVETLFSPTTCFGWPFRRLPSPSCSAPSIGDGRG